MLPNWIYYWLGKKSGGEPTPPEPPTPTKPVVPNGLRMFASSYLQYFGDVDINDFISGLDFSNVTRWNSYFYAMSGGGGLKLTLDLSNIELKEPIVNLENFAQSSNCFQTIKLWKTFNSSGFPVGNTNYYKGMFGYCTNLVDIIGIEKMDFGGAQRGYNDAIKDIIKNDTNLSNETLINLAHALLTVPDYYGYKTLSHIGYSSSQASYVVNNSPDWATLQTNGWTTGY